MADPPKGKEDEGVAARWSRRKLEARVKQEPAADAGMQDTPDAIPMQEEETSPRRDPDEIIDALPPIESLTADSDFTPFLDRAVPAELRRLALRKLWLSDPVFANLDGLNDYDDDFRTLGVGKLVRTAYQVGKGMVTRAENSADQTDETAQNVDATHAENETPEDQADVDATKGIEDEEPQADA